MNDELSDIPSTVNGPQEPLSPPGRPEISGFVIVAELGTGAFGRVFKAHDTRLDRHVAIKLPRISGDQAHADETKGRFLEEAKTAASLDHPHLVPVYQAGELDDGSPYAVMKYLAGGTLSNLLEREQLSTRNVASLMVRVCEAVDHAHRKGKLVHRDLKPDNILLDEEGQPHVADFGLAIHKEKQRWSSIAGTLPYMSPEQITSPANLDGRSDIWSLGVILYRMLTRKLPFPGPKNELVGQILGHSPEPPRQIDATIPEGLERVCLKCIARDLEQRYTTASDVAKQLRRFSEPLSIWNVPYVRNNYFTGREGILRQVRDALSNEKAAALIHTIGGLGGVGKTETAVEYAYRYRHEYRAVLWVRAGSDAEVRSSFVELARLMDLIEQDQEDEDVVVRGVIRWLENHSDWLLIFDNADQPDVVKSYRPSGAKGIRGHLLLTSRAQVFDLLGIRRPTFIEEMTLSEALEFLLKRTGREDCDDPERQAAKDLSEELGCLPLALEQAAAFVTKNSCSFLNYVKSFRRRRLELLEKSRAKLRDYPKSVATTWTMNFEDVEQTCRAAADILRICAFLHPDRIPFELFTKAAAQLGPAVAEALADTQDDPVVMDIALQSLVRYSLIRRELAANTCTMHRMVQAVIKDALNEDRQIEWIERVVAAQAAAFPTPEHMENWRDCERFVPHVLVASQLMKDHDIATSEAAVLTSMTGDYLKSRGRYTLAEPLYEQALEIRRKRLGEDNAEFALSVHCLAEIYRVMGRYEEAEPLFKRALNIRRTTLGNSHPDFATSLNYLARLYEQLGRFKQAEPLFKQALDIRREVLGETHAQTGTSLNYLAGLYESQGRDVEAEALYKQALEIRQNTPGKDHPEFADSLNDLGVLYKKMDRHEEAETLYKQASEIYRKVYGEDHPEFAVCIGNLAELYRKMVRYEDAEPLYKQSLEIIRGSLGENHPHYGFVLTGLACNYYWMGRYEDAEPLYLRALDVFRVALGQDDPSFGTALHHLALLYEGMGRYEEAEPLYKQTIEMTRKTLGEGNREFATRLGNLASLYKAMARYDEAEPLYLQAMEIIRETLGEEHSEFATDLTNLANLYDLMERYEEAEPLYKRALEVYRTALGEKHPHFAHTLAGLAGLYESMKRYDKAELLYRKALAIRRDVLGEEHLDFARNINDLAVLLREMGRYEEAEPLFEQAVKVFRTVLGENHPTFATGLYNTAKVYALTGRNIEAEPIYKQALQIRREVLGERHPRTATCLNDLAELYRVMGRYEEAEPLYKQALQIRRTALGEEHPHTVSVRESYTLLREQIGGAATSPCDE